MRRSFSNQFFLRFSEVTGFRNKNVASQFQISGYLAARQPTKLKHVGKRLLMKLKDDKTGDPQIASVSRRMLLTFYNQRERLGSTTGHELLDGAMDQKSF